jgi:GAF domain-containing protein
VVRARLSSWADVRLAPLFEIGVSSGTAVDPQALRTAANGERSRTEVYVITGMVGRLLEQSTVEGAIQTILDDVIALHGAEFGNIQLPIGKELVIVAQRSLSAEFLKTFRRVYSYEGTACGRALRLGEIVQIANVEKDPEFTAYRIDARRAGFRSVLSAPFFTKTGKLMGVVSTHFANLHRPSEVELEMLRAYRIVAADHVYQLLDDVPLSAKAEQMSEQLYAGILRDPIRSDLQGRARTGQAICKSDAG